MSNEKGSGCLGALVGVVAIGEMAKGIGQMVEWWNDSSEVKSSKESSLGIIFGLMALVPIYFSLNLIFDLLAKWSNP